ncbi:MAG: hypothetical protein PHC61_06460 [Chitinivibrionales bacterium]|nr:hypothetical protein [Chitinivibrionales bacterium]
MPNNADLIALLSSVARSARLGDFRDAASSANCALGALESLPAKLTYEPRTKFLYALETLMLMQQQQDWVGYADVVEYELIPIVKKYG